MMETRTRAAKAADRKAIRPGLQRSQRNLGLRKLGRRGIGVLVIAVLWCGITYGGFVAQSALPSPSALWSHFIDLARNGYHGVPLYDHILASLRRALSGYILALLVGIPVGLVMGYYSAIGDVLAPVFAFLRPIPPISFIPLAVLYLGIGETSKVVIIFGAAFLFVVLNTETGVRSVPQDLLRVGQNLGLSRIQLFRHVILPGALPSILTGARVALSISWALVVAAELLAAQSGLGYMIVTAGNFFDLPTVYVGIVLIGILGVLMDSVVLVLQHRLLHWQGK